MMILAVDITPWAVASVAVGAVFGALVKRHLYGVFALLTVLFGAYSAASMFGMQYSIFTPISWLLSAFFGAASVANLATVLIRRVEAQLQALVAEVKTLKKEAEKE
jgi:hypothetical protein